MGYLSRRHGVDELSGQRMHNVLDEMLVGGVLVASVLYAALSLGPRTLRGRLLAGASGLLRHAPARSGLRALATRLDTAAAAKTTGSCGGCDNCGSEQSPAAPSSGSEFRVAVSQLGKRRAD